MYSRDAVKQDPILAAVGQLQFEVVQARMLAEYGVETTLEPLPLRWRVGWLGAGTRSTRRDGYSTRSA